MIHENQYNEIKSQFEQLWQYKERENNVLEIITPFVTITDSFVSVFLYTESGVWIVSDGGYVANQHDDFYDLTNESAYYKIGQEINIASMVLDVATYVVLNIVEP